MKKKILSWLLVLAMLVSCCTIIAMPASAAGASFTNLYDDANEGDVGRADVENNTPIVKGDSTYITKKLSVAAGDIVYFGPSNVGQGYQLFFYPAIGAPVQVTSAGCAEVFSFESPLLTTSSATAANKKVSILSYVAPSNGQVYITFPQEYHEFFVVTKNEPITYDSYYAYCDSKAKANLWNQYLDVKNLINEDGTVNTGNANHYATHYIAVEEGDVITWGPHQDSMYYGAVGYNANKVGVTGSINVGTNASKPMSAGVTKVATFTDDNNPVALDDNQTYSIYSYEVPEGVSYVRVLLRKEVPAYFQVQKNNEFDIEGYWELMGGELGNPYDGKNSVWFGDSICQATQDIKVGGVWYGGFVGRTSKALNMTFDHNGESGWSFSTARPGRIVNRLIDSQKDEPAEGYEVVMLHGGTNDAWQNTIVGSMTDSYSPTDFRVDTFCGALEELFYYATTLYGDTAEINYIFNYDQPKKMAGQVYAMGPHYAAALQICEKWGVTPIDLFHDQAVKDACHLTEAFIYQDWCHATLRGYDIITPFIVDKMLAATTGNTWLEDNGAIAGKIAKDLTASVAEDAHFTAESKAAFAAAAVGATNEEKLANALAAAPALEQVEGNYIPVFDMTKYTFAAQKEYGVEAVRDLVWLSNYNNQRGNSNNKTNFGDLPGYIPDDYMIHMQKDVDMNTDSYYNTNTYNEIAIGSTYNPVDFDFDGHGHKIINWRDGVSGKTAAGATCATAIFHVVKNSTIKNVTIDKAETMSSGWDALLVGRAWGDVTIENCHVTNSKMTKTDGNGMAAILVQPYDTAETGADKYLVKNCTVSNTEFIVSAKETRYGNIGFVVSRAVTNNHKIENCYSYNNTLNVESNTTIVNSAGILGEAYQGQVKNCGVYNNTYNFKTEDSSAAALVGAVASGKTLTMANCYSDSATAAMNYGSGTVNATNCYSVQAGTTTLDAITTGILAVQLKAGSDDAWGVKEIATDVALPMVAEDASPIYAVELGEDVFYTNYKTGKITLGEEQDAKIWKYQDQTLLSSDIEGRVFTKNEKWAVAEYLLGDCMGGNTLDTADAIAMLQTLAGKTVEGYQAVRADITADGDVTLADVVRVLRYIAAGRSVA